MANRKTDQQLLNIATKSAALIAHQLVIQTLSRNKLFISLLVLMLGLQQVAFTQASEKTPYDPSRKFSAKQLQTDFGILTNALAKTHPALYAYLSPEAWQNLTAETHNQLTEGLTEAQFQLMVRKCLAQVRCGHTVALPSEAWYAYQKENPKILPVKVFIHQDKLYVREAFTADSVLTPGTEITAIQGVPAEEVLEQMRAIQPRDGNSVSFVNASVENAFQTYCLLLFGKKESYSINYSNALSGQGLVVVKGGKGWKEESKETTAPTPFITEVTNSNGRFYIPSTNARVGILDINSFGNDSYRKFYKAAFRQIEAHKVEHLVIDLRDNAGGYFPNANFLLQHLTADKFFFNMNRPEGKIKKDPHLKIDFVSRLTKNAFNLLLSDKDKTDPNVNYAIAYKPKKKNPYTGKVYVLTNGSTFSISSYMATQLKHKANTLVIGDETGGGEVSANGILFYKLTLPATGTRVVLPYYQLETIRGAAQTGHGLKPDVPVVYTKEEILEKKNKELDQALQLISQGR